MSGWRQGWLVAAREMRERSRSKAFRLSLILMMLVVVAVIVLPSLIGKGDDTKDVGLTGAYPQELPASIKGQLQSVGKRAVIHRYATVAAGERAVRDGKVDVLVVGNDKLEWRRQVDEQLQAVVTGSLQLAALRERATSAGIDPERLFALVAPVRVDNVELGQVEGRGPDDETAAFVMTIVLFMTITTYGSLVLAGVVEEKSSRVVEVLLARIPARSLLAGKVAGIGLLGLVQVALTAVAAVVAGMLVDTFDVPAARSAVIAWAVAWFILGYGFYAVTYGALGSLASRTEDAQSAAGPVMAVLFVGYFASFATIGSPDAAWAKVVSYLPPTAPFAMPNRIAMGATAWWEPVFAAGLTIAAIAGLVVLGGRVYSRAILRTGPVLKLRDVLRERGNTAVATEPAAAPAPAPRTASNERRTEALLIAAGVGVAALAALVLHDVILGVAIGAGFIAVTSRVAKARGVAHH